MTRLKNDYGANAVRYSLLSAAVTTTLGALLFIWAARSIRNDIQRAKLIRIGRSWPLPIVLSAIFALEGFLPLLRAFGAVCSRSQNIRRKRPKNHVDETISRNPRNHPETDRAYIFHHQMAHRRLGGIT